MKQKMFLILFGSFALFLGIFLSVRGNGRVNQPSTVLPTPRRSVAKPSVIVIPEAPSNISFESDALPVAPSTLPVYSYTPIALSLTDASLLAARFGFSEKPLKTTGGSSTTHQWSQDDNTLTFVSQQNTSWLSFAQPTKSLFSSMLVKNPQQGIDLLQTILPQEENQCAVQLLRTSAGPFDGVVSPDVLAGYYNSCLTPNQKPIVTESFNPTLVSLVANQEGILRSFSLDTLFSLTQRAEQPILAPSEAIFNIKKEGGILVSVSRGGNFSFFDTPPQFDAATISSYSFVYYPNANTSTLEPYYVFEGMTKTTGGESLVVKYAFPAAAKN